ncbi:hypothetical protein QFC22_006021 [Naganishia vaughanmartiniae]|uniref:Uncharacterized protein n=1 Tax=Naganishia vaughanmartiniae TaxID=1424756 RepID=A0ACC2WNH1_9TREE|nr:hypothetical protein QFC22_006021 [Naganishia vaughanmartiniae]
MHPSKANQLWALLLALLAISNPAIVIASAVSTSNLSIAVGTQSNLGVGVVPSRHQKMEKRFVGSLRNDPAMRRKLGRGDGDTVHVGRGGKFELVKKQQLTSDVTVDQNTFDAVKLAALIESIVAGDEKTVSSSASTGSSLIASASITTTTSVITSSSTTTSQLLPTSTADSTTLASTSMLSLADATEATTSPLARTTPPSSTVSPSSTMDVSSSSAGVSREDVIESTTQAVTESSAQAVIESSTQAVISTESTELEWIWQLVKPWRMHTFRRRGDAHSGVLRKRQVENMDGEDVHSVQIGTNTSVVAANLASGTGWIDTLSSWVPSASITPPAADLSSVDGAPSVIGSDVMESFPTSYVEPVPMALSTSLPDLETWSAMTVALSNAELLDQVASTGESRLGVRSEAIVASGATEEPQEIGLGAPDPASESLAGMEMAPVPTQTLAPSWQEVEVARLASGTRDSWPPGTQGWFDLAQPISTPSQPAGALDESALPEDVPTLSLFFSGALVSPAATLALADSSDHPLVTGPTRYSGAAESTTEIQGTRDLAGRPFQTYEVITYTRPTPSLPRAPEIPAGSASRDRYPKPSNASENSRYFHHDSGIVSASTTPPVPSSTLMPQVTGGASSAYEEPSSVPTPTLSPVSTEEQVPTPSSTNVESDIANTTSSSDGASAPAASSTDILVERSSSVSTPASTALPEVTTIVTVVTESQSDASTLSSTLMAPPVESSATVPLSTADPITSDIRSSVPTGTVDETVLTPGASTGPTASATSDLSLASSTDSNDSSSIVQSTSLIVEVPSSTSVLFEQPSSTIATIPSSSESISSDILSSSTVILPGTSTLTKIPQPTTSQDTFSSFVESSALPEPTPTTPMSFVQTSTEVFQSTWMDASSSSEAFPTSSVASSSTDTVESSPIASTSVSSDGFTSTVTFASVVPTTTASQNVSSEPTSTSMGSTSMESSQASSMSSGQSTQTKAIETSTESIDLQSSTATSSDIPIATGGSNSTTSQMETGIPVSVTTTSAMTEPTQTISGNQTVSITGNATFTDTATSSPVVTAPASESSGFEWASSSDTSSPTASSSSEEPYIPSQTYLIYATPTSTPSSWTADQASWATESVSVTTSSAVIMPSTATIPSNVPTIIVPYNSPAATAGTEKSKTSSDASNASSLISILLNANNYPWDFVVSNSDATSQLFINFPLMIANALGIDESNVTTYALQAYSPAAVQGESTSVLTRWIGYIPTAKVTDLSSYIKTPSSPLYRQAGIAGQLAAQIDSSYPLTGSSTSASTSSDPESSESESKSKNHRDIIIGVCVGVGGALWVALVFWIYRRVKRNHDANVHKRLSEHGSFVGNGMDGGYLPEGRHSRTSSLAASEIDARPSSFYADPSENEARNRRQSHAATQRTTWNARASHEQGRPDRLSTTGFSSWFRSSGSHNSHSNRLSHGEGFGSLPQMTQLQNPFADSAHRSYLDQGPNRSGGGASTWRRSHTPKPISKNQIGQPTLQANSLEFTDHR